MHDNEAVTEAMHSADDVYPVYVFDERLFFESTRFGFRKCGAHRCRFILESVRDLRDQLRSLGSDLIVRVGKPEDELFEIAKQLRSRWVFCNRERTPAEVAVQDQLEQNLWSIGQEIRYTRGKMLYYTGDLPFPVTHTPDAFSTFRKEVLEITPIREPLARPLALNPVTSIDSGVIPELSVFRHDDIEHSVQEQQQFTGGESVAIEQLNEFRERMGATKGGKGKEDISSKLSPWITNGCLSPKLLYSYFAPYRPAKQKDDVILQALLRRDFLRLVGKKHRSSIFRKGGTLQKPREDLREDVDSLNKWINGSTGVPLVDAYMNELAQVGFIEDRGRIIVAHYLVKTMQVNWQVGASYFESVLLDYDPCSNYGNWNRIADVDLDDQKIPSFNLAAQIRQDPSLVDYIRRWVPSAASSGFSEIEQAHSSLA